MIGDNTYLFETIVCRIRDYAENPIIEIYVWQVFHFEIELGSKPYLQRPKAILKHMVVVFNFLVTSGEYRAAVNASSPKVIANW
jgi:hypothetical protein